MVEAPGAWKRFFYVIEMLGYFSKRYNLFIADIPDGFKALSVRYW